ncbi:MAG: GLPGLI family protein [Flavobacteriaceae bacterium]
MIKILSFLFSNYYKHIVICFIFFHYVSYSQNDKIIVYDVYLSEGSIENSELKTNSKVSFIYNGVDDAIDSMEGVLEFNKGVIHSYIRSNHIEQKPLRLARSLVGADEYYFGVYKDTIIRKRELLGETFFIKFPPNKLWNIHNEKKTIGEYECFKATQEKEIILGNNKVKRIVVEAWFCPDLTFPYGPKDYCGLPGLILELKEDKVAFVVNKVSFSNKNNIKINFLDKVIDEKEYQKKLKEKTDYFFEMIGR